MTNGKALTAAARQALAATPASMRELAQRAGVAPPTVWRIARGERGVTIDSALALAGALEEYAAQAADAAAILRTALNTVTRED